MEYLINIQGLMNLGAEAGTMVFDTTIGKEELQDMDIKKVWSRILSWSAALPDPLTDSLALQRSTSLSSHSS